MKVGTRLRYGIVLAMVKSDECAKGVFGSLVESRLARRGTVDDEELPTFDSSTSLSMSIAASHSSRSSGLQLR